MRSNELKVVARAAGDPTQRMGRRSRHKSRKPEAVAARAVKIAVRQTEKRVRADILAETPPWLINLSPQSMPMTPEALRRLGLWLSTYNEAASFLGVSPSTLSRRMRENPELRTAWDDGHEQARNTLRRRQLEVANSDAPQAAALLIHLGKTILNQRDRVEHTGSDGGPIRYNHIRRTIVDPARPEGEQVRDLTRPRPEPNGDDAETRH